MRTVEATSGLKSRRQAWSSWMENERRKTKGMNAVPYDVEWMSASHGLSQNGWLEICP